MNQKNVVSLNSCDALQRPAMNIKVTNPTDQCTLSEMLETLDSQLDLHLSAGEKYLKDLIIDFVGLAPHFFHARHTVGKSEYETPAFPMELADDMPPEIPTLTKICGMIREDVKLDFQKGTVRTRKSPRHAKDNQLGVWSLTPNAAGDDWIISVEVPGYLQRAELTFSAVFTSTPKRAPPAAPPASSPGLLDLPLLSLSPLSSFSLSPSPEHSPVPFLLVPTLSPQTSWSSMSSMSLSEDFEDCDSCYFPGLEDDINAMEICDSGYE